MTDVAAPGAVAPVGPGGVGAVDTTICADLQWSGAPDQDAPALARVWRTVGLFPQVLVGGGRPLLEQQLAPRTTTASPTQS